MKHFILLLTAVCFVFGLRAEDKILYTHYTTDDGLSQNRVMDIEQDHKGFMWFATWDGLNRFDGKDFRVYKGVPGDPEGLDNNRLLSVQEDAYGYLWLLTGYGQVYRFNPVTEQFKRLSYNPSTKIDLVKNPVFRIVLLRGKKAALLSPGGCILIRINPDGSLGKIVQMRHENGKLASNLVQKVFTDNEDEVWFLTNSGLTCYNYTFNRFQHYFNQEQNKYTFTCFLLADGKQYFGSSSGHVWYRTKKGNSFNAKPFVSSAPISDICMVSHDRLLIATLGDGVYVTNLQLHPLKHYTVRTDPMLGSDSVYSLFRDKMGTIWLEADVSGVVCYESWLGKLYHFDYKWSGKSGKSPGFPNFKVLEDNMGHTWVHARRGGFFTFDRINKKLVPFSKKGNQPSTPYFNSMTDALVDKDGNLWISTGEPRLEKCTFEPEKFVFEPVASIHKEVDGVEVRTLFEDGRNRLWICDREGKIQLKDVNGRLLGYLHRDGSLSDNMEDTGMRVYDMLQDKKGRIWMACKGAGVVLLTERTGKKPAFTIRFFNDGSDEKARPNSTLCYSLLEDTKGRIWVGTFVGGLNLVDESDGSVRFIHSKNGLTGYPLDRFSNIRDMGVDKAGIIWLATDNGLVAFDSKFTSPGNIRYYTFQRDGNDAGSLRTNDVHSVFIDDKGYRYFGTFGGGLNVLDKKARLNDKLRFRSLTQKDGLPNDIVMSIEVDVQGFLWLFSENSITRFVRKTAEVDVYNKDYGLEPVMFTESPSLRLHNGDICAGTMKGYYRFNPSSIKKVLYTPPLYFTDFYLFDKQLSSGKFRSPLGKNVDGVDRIVLKREQTVFSIEFAALDFRNPRNIQYAYKLDPIDKTWVSLNKTNKVTFSNLAPGEYTLRVRSTNSEGVWMKNERNLKLIIRPSAWQTGWAFALYAAVGLMMLFLLHRRLLEKYTLRSKLSLEKKVIDAKKQFLSNVTRELRIPLMLMEAPIEQVSRDKGLSPDSRNNLSIVQRNIDRMVRLVNRILDYQKNFDRKMTLMVEETCVADLCAKIAGHFEAVAKERGILFEYSDQSNRASLYLDKEKFDTILHILLTNAVKFTKGGKRIFLKIYPDKQDIIVKVEDEGTGISKENMEHLFDRFNVVEETDEDSGIGIGLSLAKELVELHGGSIQATSQEGIGTSFELRFKLGKDHFLETDVVLLQPEFYPGEIPDDTGLSWTDQEIQAIVAQQPLFMVVENETDPRQSAAAVLSKQYRVAAVTNTPATWDSIDRLMPDYVVIDQDVSGDGGLRLAIIMKESERTCHIPVIYLSKKSSDSLIYTSLPTGIDELVTKPFNASYLQARIEHILVQRGLLREKIRKDVLDATSRAFTTTVSVEPWDEEFLTRIMDFLADNLSNSELTVDLLVSVIGLGKSVFVSKLKSLLGLSPLELIREIRMKRAIELLESGKYSVSEVVIQIGMKDARAFSTYFKQRFGLSPTEFRNKFASNQ